MLRPGRYTRKALFVPKVTYDTSDTSKQYGSSPDSEKQALLTCGLPTGSKKILTAKDVFASMPAPGTPMLNNLTSPGASGPLGTVAQEEALNKTIPPNKIIISIVLIEITSFYYLSFFLLHLPIHHSHHLQKLLLREYPFLDKHPGEGFLLDHLR